MCLLSLKRWSCIGTRLHLFSEECWFLKLPTEVLILIMNCLEADEGYCKLYEVCKRLRDVIYSNRTNFVMKVDLQSIDLAPLPSMPNLKQLKIISLDAHTLENVAHYFQTLAFSHLNHLTLCHFQFRNEFKIFVDALSHVKLAILNCLSCAKISVDDLKYLLNKVPSIRCCNVDISLDTDETMLEFAMIANTLAGKVNLSLNALELVPPRLLFYPWNSYHAMFPAGQTH